MRSARAWEVLQSVHGLEGEALREAIDRACGDDVSLHAQVACLVARRAHPSLDLRAGSEIGAWGAAPAPAPPSVPGFTLLRKLGEGGAGEVFEAEQANPRRRVALKVFARRSADPVLHRRIEHEAEILAHLHHACIAQVHAFHAGSPDSGSPPWIAMELVRGRPIDVWCRERRLTLDVRVGLLATVAEAVAHAHAHGIVHRDLKPSNVLVTEQGGPKVVDFGLAKMLGAGPAGGTLHTREGDLVGTIAYMAAEQAQGSASLVDTRTDVHALGVMAFQLLSGRLPRNPLDKSLPEWARELLRPAPSLRDALPGAPLDLALVVGKALEGDRDRRYPTAQAFADDLRRYLRAEPVQARAPTRGYLLRSFVRRHRPLVVSTLSAVVALATGLALSLQASLESAAQRKRADQQAERARLEAYRARTSVAAESLAAGNAFAARSALERAPEAFRGWEWRYLDAQVERAARVVPYAVTLEGWRALSADGSRLAGGQAGGRAVVLDARTGQVLRRLGGGRAIERGVFLPDGRRLVLARADGGLEVLDLESGATQGLAAGGQGGRNTPCDALCAAPGGARVCESRRDAVPRLRLVDVEAGTSQLLEAPDASHYLDLAFRADGGALAAAAGNGAILCWDLGRPDGARQVGQHSGVAHQVAFLPDGEHLVSCGVDRHLLRLSARPGPSTTLALHQQLVTALAVSPDGGRVATWSGERVLRVLDALDGRLLASWQAVGAGEQASVRWSRDGAQVEVCDDRARRVWFASHDTGLDLLRGHLSLEQGNPFPYVYDVAFSPDGRRVATAGWDGQVRISSAATGCTLAALTAPGPVQALAWSHDGQRIATTGRPHHVVLFDADTGRELARSADGHVGMVGGLAFSPDDRRLLTSTLEDGPVVRDARTLERVEALGPPRWMWSCAWNQAGLVLGYGDGSWEWRAGGPRGRRLALPGHRAAVVGVALSADGALVAAASEDGSASLVETGTGRRRALLHAHVGRVYTVAFSPDGTRLATGGDDGTVRLHDTGSGEEVLVLRGHASYVHGLSFAPDGATLASASGDNTARLWSTWPLAQRMVQRERELERLACAHRRVAALLAGGREAGELAAALRVGSPSSPAERAADLDALLQLCQPAQAVPGAAAALR